MADGEESNGLEERIYGWLIEEGFSPQPISDVKAIFNYQVNFPNGYVMHVAMPVNYYDKLLIGINIGPGPSQQDKISAMNLVFKI